MKPHLLLRKKLKELVNDPRGFSSIVGTIFMVIVVVLLSTNVFLWTLSQNTLYNEAVKEKNQLEVDRLNERVKAFYANYTVASGKVSVSAKLQNQGPLSVQITNLWVRNINKNLYNFSGPLNVNLQPGGNSTLKIDVTIIGSVRGDRFSSWLITGRGNVVPLEETEAITVAKVAYGIGAISMDFADFKYYNVIYNAVKKVWVLNNYPNGVEGYSVSFSNNIAFQVNLTNYDYPDKRNIVLYSGSMFWMIFPVQATQPRSVWWYIVNVDDTGTIAKGYTSITLPYGVPTRVYFASANDMSASFNPSPLGIQGVSAIKLPSPAAVNLMLVGQIGTSTYGQNIPFVSVFVNP